MSTIPDDKGRETEKIIYLNDEFEVVSPEIATLVKVIYTNGDVEFLVPAKE